MTCHVFQYNNLVDTLHTAVQVSQVVHYLIAMEFLQILVLMMVAQVECTEKNSSALVYNLGIQRPALGINGYNSLGNIGRYNNLLLPPNRLFLDFKQDQGRK